MNDPGAFSLGDFPLAAAGQQTGTPVSGLDGMASLALSARQQFGNAQPGSSVAAIVQTSLDQGQSWFDLACFGFGDTAGGLQVAQLVPAALAPTVPSSGTMASGALAAGAALGDRLRVVVTVAGGGYGNATLLSLWAVAR